MTFKEQLDRCDNPELVDRVQLYLRQWAYDCAKWERYAIAEFGSRGEKCKASQKMTRISRGFG